MTDSTVTINNPVNVASTPDLPASTARPEHIPAKFWDAEKGAVRVDELAKSYSALETKLGAPKTPAATAATPEDPPATPETPEVPQGVDYAKLQAEFVENGGKLTDATMADLTKRGISKEAVEDFVAAKQAQADHLRAYALEGIGDETHKSVVEWAKSNLTPADLDAYNKLVSTAKSKEDLRAAVANLHARYEQANGSEPSFLNGSRVASSGANVYRDLSEMMTDMNSPRYHQSQAFRDEVAAKLARSSIM